MNSFVRYIGIIDHKGRTHSVTLGPGVNVITGKSSTGKSALIEIFDFCFGSSDFTVPDGVITKNARIYFTVLRVQEVDLVLARKHDESWAFLKSESDLTALNDPNVLTSDYFAKEHLRSFDDYKREIGRWLRLDITDTQEDVKIREHTGRKSPSPSVRSFASFMLQHQNLIANKHAIFYRFDEKEKREQVIEHFKIFLGFADQTYFLKSQELNSLQAKRKVIESQIPRLDDLKASAALNIQDALDQYGAISGTILDIGKPTEVVKYPLKALKKLGEWKVNVMPLSNEHVKLREKLEMERSALTSKFRLGQRALSAVASSIAFAKAYDKTAASVQIPQSVEIRASQCPFCKSEHSLVEQQANKLLGAIDWLNQELERSSYRLESFEEQERKTQQELEALKQQIDTIDTKIALIDKQTAELAKFRSQYELALRAKLRIEAILEELIAKPDQKLGEQLKTIKSKIIEITSFLEQNYNVAAKLQAAEAEICDQMEKLGSRFEFEESYRPIRLRFSCETFDLWHEAGNRKVFLRSMGSGANWLYSHLTLFLALQHYFCTLGDKCSIPSILFLDQPSQVYFPSVLDNANEFSAQELAEKEGVERKRPVDEDIAAVTNLYSQLVRFCKDTKKETGIEPQIIVTDHADKLEIEGEVVFESLVKGRWRQRGFIDLKEAEPHHTK